MKTYEYRGFDRSGRACKGFVEASSVKNARERLAGDGVLAERLLLTGRRTRYSSAHRAATYRQLSALLSAGITLEKALDLLVKSPEMRDAQGILAGVLDRVREGSSLAAALVEMSDSVNAFEQAIIEAAEKSATVDVMLERLADFIEEQEKLRSGILSAMLYPSIVIIIAVIIAVLMLVFFVPWTQRLMLDNNMQMPLLTRIMMRAGSILRQWIIPIMIGVSGVVYFWTRKYVSDDAFRVRWNRKLFSCPVVGKGYSLLVNLRFARTMSILLDGGVSLIEGMLLSGRATGSPWIAQLAERESEAIKHGTSLSDAVRNIPPLSGTLAGWIQTGEASGELSRLMEKAGVRCQDQWNRYTSRMLTMLEPLLILMVASFVLLVILSVLLPVINLSQAVQ